MTQEEKLDALMKDVTALKEQLDKQDEKLDYIVARLNHMRDRAHEQKEKAPQWPK